VFAPIQGFLESEAAIRDPAAVLILPSPACPALTCRCYVRPRAERRPSIRALLVARYTLHVARCTLHVALV